MNLMSIDRLSNLAQITATVGFIGKVTVVSASLSSLAGCAQYPTASMAARDDESRVLATEDDYVAAEVSRDEARLRKLIDDRFVFNSARGTTSGKEELIQSVLQMNMVGQSVRERSVLIEGDIAFVFGTADLQFARPGQPESVSSLRYTATYVRRGGQWRMLALQMQPRSPDQQQSE